MRIFSRTEPLIGVEEFKKRYLFGVDLRDADGNDLSDDVIAAFINVSIDYIEMELNCPIQPIDMVESVDYKYPEYRQYCYIQVPTYPIVTGSVKSVRLNFSDQIGVDFPPEWFRVYETTGQIQLMPNVNTLSSVLIRSAGILLPRVIASSYAPKLLKIEYKAGLADEEGKVPPLINQAIGLYSALYILQFLGDIGPGGGAGISSQSLSLDGLSQSITTALSATNNLFGATILNYKSQLDKVVMPTLRKKFKRINLSFI